jgi:hypothetical protein
MGGGDARLDGALAGTTSSGMLVRLLSIVALTFLLAVTAQAAIVINVNKSSQTMTVIVDGTPRYEWLV